MPVKPNHLSPVVSKAACLDGCHNQFCSFVALSALSKPEMFRLNHDQKANGIGRLDAASQLTSRLQKIPITLISKGAAFFIIPRFTGLHQANRNPNQPALIV